MFTIEHEFDATVITLVDDGDTQEVLQEDVIISAFEECITLSQIDPRTDQAVTVTLSLGQLRDLSMALNLPEGSYLIRKET